MAEDDLQNSIILDEHEKAELIEYFKQRNKESLEMLRNSFVDRLLQAHIWGIICIIFAIVFSCISIVILVLTLSGIFPLSALDLGVGTFFYACMKYITDRSKEVEDRVTEDKKSMSAQIQRDNTIMKDLYTNHFITQDMTDRIPLLHKGQKGDVKLKREKK